MPFSCTCSTLELSSHVVENLWPGTTETNSPQEFLLARVSTIIMDILNDLLLARCERFPDTCVIAAILIVNRHFVHYQLVSPIAVWIKFVLLCLQKSEPRSSVSGQTGIVSLGVSLASGL